MPPAVAALAPCPREEACPPQLTKASEHAKAGRAATAQTSPVPYWTRPARTAVGTAAVPAPATPLLEWPRCPDPQPGWRVSIRPQPTRAPQGEAMALGPPRGRGSARAVARGPTLSWGVGGTAGGAAAAALRLLLAPGVTRTVASLQGIAGTARRTMQLGSLLMYMMEVSCGALVRRWLPSR